MKEEPPNFSTAQAEQRPSTTPAITAAVQAKIRRSIPVPRAAKLYACRRLEVECERVQACVEFFTKCVVNQALTRDAGKPLEGCRLHREMIVGFSTGARASVAGV